MARMRAMRDASDGTHSGGTRRWLLVLAALTLPVSLPGAAVLLAASCPLLLLALLFDRDPSRRVLRAVGLFSLAALIGPIHQFLHLGCDIGAALQVMLDGAVIRVWAAGGIGWAFSELAAFFGMVLTHLQAGHREKRLKQELAALREEWELPEE